MLHIRALPTTIAALCFVGTVGAGDVLVGPTWQVSRTDGNSFGRQIDGAGDVNGDGFDDVLVSSSFGDLEGRAYLYFGSSSGPSATEDWFVQGIEGELLGYSIAGAGDVNGDGFDDVIVGGPEYNADGHVTREGIVRVYYGAPGGPPTTPSWTFEGVFPEYWEIGWGVAGAGDVNGDGFDDVLVAANLVDPPVLAFYGSPTGLGSTPDWIREFEYLFAFGRSIDGAGDVNGDGFDDIVLGAGDAVFVYFGSNAGLGDASAVLPPPVPSGQWGKSVAGAGDIDGDSFDDIVVGGSNEAFVYFGPLAGPIRKTSLTGGPIGEDFGDGVAGGGDVDGDGFADVLVAAQGSTASGIPGRVYLYLGQAGGIVTNPSQVVEALDDNHFFGRSLAGAGNLDGDGLEILIGAHSNAVPSKAYVYAFSGPDAGPGVPAVGHAGLWLLVGLVLATASLALYRRTGPIS